MSDVPSTYSSKSPIVLDNAHILAVIRKLHPVDWPPLRSHQVLHLPDSIPEKPIRRASLPQYITSPYWERLLNSYAKFLKSPNIHLDRLMTIFINWLSDGSRGRYDQHSYPRLLIGGTRHHLQVIHAFSYRAQPYVAVINDAIRLEEKVIRPEQKGYNAMNIRSRNHLCVYDWAVLVAQAYDISEYAIDPNLNNGRYVTSVVYPDKDSKNMIFITAYITREALEGLTESPPKLYPEGMSYTRFTVPFPTKSETDVMQCALLQTMMALIEDGAKDLDTAPPMKWEPSRLNKPDRSEELEPDSGAH